MADTSLAEFYKSLRERNAARSYYAPVAQSVLQADVTDPYGSATSNFGANLLKGLLAGTAANLYRDEQAKYETDLAAGLRATLGGASAFKSALPEEDLASISAFKLAMDLNNQQEEAKTAREIDKFFKTQGALEDQKGKVELLKEAIKNPKSPFSQQLLSANGIDPLVKKDGEVVGDGDNVKKSVFGIPGETASERFRKEMQGLVEEGATPTSAIEGASKLTAVDRKDAELALKKIESIRTKAKTMEGLAATAEAGVEGAGETGGFLGGGRDLASRIYALFSPEEAQQRSSQGLLDSIAPDIIKGSRDAGTGAMSDPEMREYLRAGPTSAKTPLENRMLIEKIKNVSKLDNEYADFLDTFLAERGSLQGGANAPSADQLWELYRKNNPLFLRNPDTQELEFNSNRPSWRDFDFVSALEGKSQQAAPISTGAPSIGQSFNGEKVIAVRKVR